MGQGVELRGKELGEEPRGKELEQDPLCVVRVSLAVSLTQAEARDQDLKVLEQDLLCVERVSLAVSLTQAEARNEELEEKSVRSVELVESHDSQGGNKEWALHLVPIKMSF